MIKHFLLLSLLSYSLFSQTTLCYKENLASLSLIETTTLKGEVCQDNKTTKDMNKLGWITKDIKVTPKDGLYSFVYIFEKKSSLKTMGLDVTLENLEKQKKTNILVGQIANGKKIYIKKCTSCHGNNGEVIPFGASTKLMESSYDDMRFDFNKIIRSDYASTTKYAMFSYVYNTTSNDLKDIVRYLNKINGTKNKVDEE